MPVATKHPTAPGGRTFLIEWNGLSQGDTDGDAVRTAGWVEKTVHLAGNFGTGAVVIEGSNYLEPGSGDWVTLNNAFASPLSNLTSAGAFLILEHMLWTRVRVTGEDGATNLTAKMSAKGGDNA